MAEDQINSIIDRQAVQKEIDDTKAGIQSVIDLIRSVKGINIDVKGATSIKEYRDAVAQLNTEIPKLEQSVRAVSKATQDNTNAVKQSTTTIKAESASLQQNIEARRRLQTTIDSYKASQKEDLMLLRAGTITRKEYTARINESAAKIEIYRNKIIDLNKDIKTQINEGKDANNLYKQLSKQYNEAALAAKNYNLQLGATNPITVAATKKAADLGAQLKQLDATVGQNQRNVGNYGGALVGFFQKSFGYLRTLSYLIPGIGIAGIISLVTTQLGGMVMGLFNSTKGFDKAKESAKAYAEVLQKVNEESIKGSAGDTAKLELYRSILTDVTRSQNERNQALAAYNGIADDANKIDVTQLNNLNLINEKISQQILLIERRALSRAAESILADKAEALLLAKENARLRAEEQVQLELESGAIVVNQNIGKAFEEMERKRIVNQKIASDKSVQLRQIEFDEAKKGLYGLLKVEGFTADQIKIVKEKAKKDEKKDNTAELNAKARLEILKLEMEIRADFAAEIFQDETQSYSRRLLALNDYANAKQKIIDATAEYELLNTKLTASEIELVETKRIDSSLRLAHELSTAITGVLKKNFDTTTKEMAEGIKGMTKSMADQIKKAQAEFKALQDKAIANAADLKKRIKDAIKELIGELQGLIFDLFTSDIDRQRNAVQDQIDLLEERKQKEIEVANQTIASAQERAAAISIIEARAAGQREQLEKRQRQLAQERARFERAQQIASIIQGTAVAVVGALGAKPWTPANIVLAAIVGAIGLAQLTRALIAPIPKYGKGTQNHPGGPMEVGDAGKHEGIVLPDGSVLKSPARSTVMDAPAGTKVYADYDRMMLNATMTKVPEFKVKTVSNDNAIKQVGKDIVRAIKNQPQPIFKGVPAWKKFMRTGSTIKDYLQ